VISEAPVAAIVVPIIVILVIVGVVLLVLWKKGKLCKKGEPKEKAPPADRKKNYEVDKQEPAPKKSG
jgi:hypothetical protein